jgi:hypothetical protein
LITWGRRIADDWVQGLSINSSNLDAFKDIPFYNRGGPVLNDTVNVYLIYVGFYDKVWQEVPKFINQLSNSSNVPNIWGVLRKYNSTLGVPVASNIRVASQCVYTDNGFTFFNSKITQTELSKILGQVVNETGGYCNTTYAQFQPTLNSQGRGYLPADPNGIYLMIGNRVSETPDAGAGAPAFGWDYCKRAGLYLSIRRLAYVFAE